MVSDYKKNYSTKVVKPFRWFLSMASEPNEMPEAFERMLLALKNNSKSGLYHAYARFPDKTHDSSSLVGMAKGTKAFPDSEILWDSLATAYSLNKKLPDALIASERALELAVANNSIFMSEIKAQNTDLKAEKKKAVN